MAANNELAHNDRDGRDPRTRMADCGYNVSVSWGENIYAGSADAQTALNWWKNSPPHNAVLLNSQYNDKMTGISRAYQAGSIYGWYWTLSVGGFDDSGTTATPTPTPTATPRPTVTPAPAATPRPWWCAWFPQNC